MTSDQLADDIVAHLNAIESPIVEFQAVNPAEVGEHLKEKRNDFAVFVIADSESETPLDRGDTCDERRTVAVIINGPIRGNMTKQTALRFGEQLRLALRETEFDGYIWAGNETTTLIDYAALKENRQFLSRFAATYFNVA
jgi:hypothetical protein